MADVVVTRADREAALLCVGSYVSPTFRPWNETGDVSGFAAGSWPFTVAIPTALAIATARAEGYAAGVEEAANVVLAHAREAASRAGEVATDAEAKAACMALALDDAAKDVRALAAREGER